MFNSRLFTKLLLFSGVHLIKNSQPSKAEEVYRELIKRNPENHVYYGQLAVATGVDSDPEKKLMLLKDMREQYPKVQAPQRLALDVAEGEWDDASAGHFF